MVRLMHSMVRYNALNRSTRWDQARYGIPIPQVDQMPAGMIGPALTAGRALRAKRGFTDDERATIETARYRCYLLGLPEELLPTDPEGITRVFLARALAQDASIYFMDEPFAGVDAATESAILKLLQQLRSAGKTVFVVHHDLQTVQRYFDWVILLNLRLLACGPVATTFTRDNLQKTYGGRLTILEQAAEAVGRRQPE